MPEEALSIRLPTMTKREEKVRRGARGASGGDRRQPPARRIGRMLATLVG